MVYVWVCQITLLIIVTSLFMASISLNHLFESWGGSNLENSSLQFPMTLVNCLRSLLGSYLRLISCQFLCTRFKIFFEAAQSLESEYLSVEDQIAQSGGDIAFEEGEVNYVKWEVIGLTVYLCYVVVLADFYVQVEYCCCKVVVIFFG